MRTVNLHEDITSELAPSDGVVEEAHTVHHLQLSLDGGAIALVMWRILRLARGQGHNTLDARRLRLNLAKHRPVAAAPLVLADGGDVREVGL